VGLCGQILGFDKDNPERKYPYKVQKNSLKIARGAGGIPLF
jgi:hypothetical protein